VSYIKRISCYLKEARKLFGFGLQNDSSIGERLLAEDVNRPRPGYEKNRLVFRGMALEATLVLRKKSVRDELCVKIYVKR
jgi:hypothetical protein